MVTADIARPATRVQTESSGRRALKFLIVFAVAILFAQSLIVVEVQAAGLHHRHPWHGGHPAPRVAA